MFEYGVKRFLRDKELSYTKLFFSSLAQATYLPVWLDNSQVCISHIVVVGLHSFVHLTIVVYTFRICIHQNNVFFPGMVLCDSLNQMTCFPKLKAIFTNLIICLLFYIISKEPNVRIYNDQEVSFFLFHPQKNLRTHTILCGFIFSFYLIDSDKTEKTHSNKIRLDLFRWESDCCFYSSI